LLAFLLIVTDIINTFVYYLKDLSN